jgi:hypothetical protein
MFSKVPVASRLVSWLLTANPTSAFDGRAMVALPTVVHVDPFADTDAVITLPVLVSRTHRGAVPVPPAVLADVLPSVARRWKARPLPADTSMKAWAAFAAVDPRIMTPTFVHASAPVIEATSAVMLASPLIGT